MDSMKDLLARYSHAGRLEWIGVRGGRRAPVESLAQAMLAPGGLEGDHARPGKRAVTLIQAEHLPAIGAFSGTGEVAPERLRRNLVISGINLSALRGVPLQIGRAVVRITVPCAPCSRMEAELGHGGYTAMRGHGGWCAEVLDPAEIAAGDPVWPVPQA